jgi:hypothetical protein
MKQAMRYRAIIWMVRVGTYIRQIMKGPWKYRAAWESFSRWVQVTGGIGKCGKIQSLLSCT